MERLVGQITNKAKDKAIDIATSPKAKKIAKATLIDVIKNGLAKRLFLRKWSKKLIDVFDGDEVAIAEFLEENLSYSKEDARRYAILIIAEDDL